MPDPVFVFWSDGRLGNQIAQYAFCHAFARRNRSRFIWVSTDGSLRRTFELGSPHQLLGIDGLLGGWMRRLRWKFAPVPSVSSALLPGEALALVAGRREIAGFFQGEEFLAGTDGDLHALFRPRARIAAAHRASVARLGLLGQADRLAVIHVRRTDYATFGSAALGGDDLRLPAEWYARAAAVVADAGVERALVVTDDPDWCRASLTLPWPFQVVSESPEVDLLHLTHGRVCIVSNSSFAWWGAWLNQTPGKIVVAPRHWLGFRSGTEYPPRVVPASWRQV